MCIALVSGVFSKSRRDCMLKKRVKYTIPSGLLPKTQHYGYKHIFPSGIWVLYLLIKDFIHYAAPRLLTSGRKISGAICIRKE